MKQTIFVVTGDHPNNCTGGSEFQAYLIAKGLSNFLGRTYFCTMFSNETCIGYEDENLIHLSIRKGFLPGKVFQFLIYAKRFKPDIFYVRCLYSFWWIKLIGIILNKPVVYHLSSDNHAQYSKVKLKTLPSITLRNFYIWATQFSAIVISQTKRQADLYKKTFNISPTVVYNAQLPCNNQVIKDYSKISVLWLGKTFKNPERFTELAARMGNQNRFEFLLVGLFTENQSSYFSAMQKNATNFKYLGYLSRNEVYEELDNAHVLINTSDAEGFPNTFIEAWFRGVIVISDKIDPDNILIDNGIGFICKNTSEMELKLKELFAGDLTKAKEYSAKAKEYAFKNHNINVVSKEIFQIIQGLYQ